MHMARGKYVYECRLRLQIENALQGRTTDCSSAGQQLCERGKRRTSQELCHTNSGVVATFTFATHCNVVLFSLQESSIDDVPKYGTVIRFSKHTIYVHNYAVCVCADIEVVNIRSTPYVVTIAPEQCCLEITHNDTDCEVIVQSPFNYSLSSSVWYTVHTAEAS